MLPEIIKNVGFSREEIQFENDIIEYIVEKYTHEAGMRKLNEIYYDIVRQINLDKIMHTSSSISHTKSTSLITKEMIETILQNKSTILPKKIHTFPQVGIVNGLYATSDGLGGITVIQAVLTYTDKKLSLEKLTGSQGDVMKESMNCALTTAWSLLPAEQKEEISKSGNYGFHIHCPESATPKDGPSAGLAITTAIFSQLTNTPIHHEIAMTGEIDLLGNACKIGGVYSKLMGALHAGVKRVLFPRENKQDIDLILLKEEEERKNISVLYSTIHCPLNHKMDEGRYMYHEKIEILLVDTIHDVLEHCLVKQKL